jgi:hypothetical protein
MFVFGVQLLLSVKGPNYTPTWYSEYAMDWNIWGSKSGRGLQMSLPRASRRFLGLSSPYLMQLECEYDNLLKPTTQVKNERS